MTIAILNNTFKVILLVLIFTITLLNGCFAQSEDTLASYPGGKEAMKLYIDNNFKWEQSQVTIKGKVFVTFIVKKDGEITDVKILKSLCETCDKEAIRLVKNMPRWNPRIKNGKKVNSIVTIPISFGFYD